MTRQVFILESYALDFVEIQNYQDNFAAALLLFCSVTAAFFFFLRHTTALKGRGWSFFAQVEGP